MSEYQYYEFHAVDRPLTAEQQSAIRKLSSRVELSATHAAFNYSYGGFRGEPLKVLEQYFDTLLYIANWGTKQLAFRLPRGAVTIEQLRPYTFGDEEGALLDLLITPQHIILNLELREEEGYGWIEGEGLLDSLIPLREAILQGDLRALYLFWLRGAAERAGWAEGDEGEVPLVEPPVPPGLGQLDSALQALAEFFTIDQDIISAAAEASPPLTITEEPLDRWVALLSEAERHAFLVRVARGEAHVGIELLRRLRQIDGSSNPTTSTAPNRTFAELQAAARHQQQQRVERERAEAERARLAKLEALAQREEQVWAEISALLAKRTASSYDESVVLLAELRDLAMHQGQLTTFDAKLAQVLALYGGSSALQRRLKEKRLV